MTITLVSEIPIGAISQTAAKQVVNRLQETGVFAERVPNLGEKPELL